jgi:dihydroorotase
MQKQWLVVCFMAAAAVAAAQAPYDLLLKGGHVIDPRNNRNGVMDVAIAAGKIAQIAPNIAPSQAKRVIPAAGLYVVPGLVDIHTHVYAGTGRRDVYCGDLSVYPDGYTFRSGVTTVVDAGTSGWKSFPDFKDRVIDRSKTRILAMLNIVGTGMCGAVEQDTSDMDPEATARVARQYPQLIVGVKTAHYQGPEWTAVERAVRAGQLADIPVMVDFGTFRPERPYQQLVLEKLRAGDISTHMYLGAVPMLDDKGKVLPYLFQARQRGVKFDVGHGAGSFLWRQAAPAIRQGWIPDSISTDLHVRSMNGGMKDMTTTMSKILILGVPFEQVIRMSTINPALEIKRPDLGHLTPGANADVAVLRLRTGEFGYLDVRNARQAGKQKIECELTIRDGQVVWDLNGLAGDDWHKLGTNY